MADITLVELNLEGASFTSHLPFSGRKVTKEVESTDDSDERATSENESKEDASSKSGSVGSKGLAVLGVLVFLVVSAAIVKYLSGGDDDDMDEDLDIEQPTGGERPVGVTGESE